MRRIIDAIGEGFAWLPEPGDILPRATISFQAAAVAGRRRSHAGSRGDARAALALELRERIDVDAITAAAQALAGSAPVATRPWTEAAWSSASCGTLLAGSWYLGAQGLRR